MSSHKPERDDELGQLIRQTLRAHIGQSDPADDGWDRIKTELITEKSAKPLLRLGLAWSPTLQAALIILLIVVSGFWLRAPTVPQQAELILVTDTPYALAQANTDIFFDEYDATTKRLMNQSQTDQPQKRLASDVDTANSPAVMIPLDLIPHPLSPAGRLLNSQISASIFGVDRDVFKRFGLPVR